MLLLFIRYFNKEGKPVDYKPLLRNTSRNCGGGLTPWNTWISCEEVRGGQCWQVDPNPNGVHHKNPKETLLGGNVGGKYETVVRLLCVVVLSFVLFRLVVNVHILWVLSSFTHHTHPNSNLFPYSMLFSIFLTPDG